MVVNLTMEEELHIERLARSAIGHPEPEKVADICFRNPNGTVSAARAYDNAASTLPSPHKMEAFLELIENSEHATSGVTPV